MSVADPAFAASPSSLPPDHPAFRFNFHGKQTTLEDRQKFLDALPPGYTPTRTDLAAVGLYPYDKSLDAQPLAPSASDKPARQRETAAGTSEGGPGRREQSSKQKPQPARRADRSETRQRERLPPSKHLKQWGFAALRDKLPASKLPPPPTMPVEAGRRAGEAKEDESGSEESVNGSLGTHVHWTHAGSGGRNAGGVQREDGAADGPEGVGAEGREQSRANELGPDAASDMDVEEDSATANLHAPLDHRSGAATSHEQREPHGTPIPSLDSPADLPPAGPNDSLSRSHHPSSDSCSAAQGPYWSPHESGARKWSPNSPPGFRAAPRSHGHRSSDSTDAVPLDTAHSPADGSRGACADVASPPSAREPTLANSSPSPKAASPALTSENLAAHDAIAPAFASASRSAARSASPSIGSSLSSVDPYYTAWEPAAPIDMDEGPAERRPIKIRKTWEGTKDGLQAYFGSGWARTACEHSNNYLVFSIQENTTTSILVKKLHGPDAGDLVRLRYEVPSLKPRLEWSPANARVWSPLPLSALLPLSQQAVHAHILDALVGLDEYWPRKSRSWLPPGVLDTARASRIKTPVRTIGHRSALLDEEGDMDEAIVVTATDMKNGAYRLYSRQHEGQLWQARCARAVFLDQINQKQSRVTYSSEQDDFFGVNSAGDTFWMADVVGESSAHKLVEWWREMKRTLEQSEEDE